MDTLSVTTKGQVTIPKHVRQKLGIRAGTRVAFRLLDDHVELVVATNQTLKIRVEGSSSEQTVIANQKDQLITLERMP